MKTMKIHLLTLATFAALITSATAQSAGFTYQGRLTDGVNAANGVYDLRFALYETLTAQEEEVIGQPLTNAAVVVSNGLFTVNLQFESFLFTGGGERWLEIAVRTNGSTADFTTLTPRQPITATPYATVAANLMGTLPSQNLEGTYFGYLNFNNSGNNFSGNFSGWGGSLQGVNAISLGGLAPSDFWQLGGNTGTSPGADFIGTTDNQPLEFKVNGIRALRLEPNILGQPNIVMGAPNNHIPPFAFGSTISGGFGHTNEGYLSTISGGVENRIQRNARWTTIAGGVRNLIDSEANYSIVGAGADNSIQTNAEFSVIGGGRENVIQTNAFLSTIGGGWINVVRAGTRYATVGGGAGNSIQGIYSTIAGGSFNAIDAQSATIAGGVGNRIQVDATSSTIGGGIDNEIAANSIEATIPGGRFNRVTASYSFAAGRQAQALHEGAFVWADSTGAPFSSTAGNEVSFRCQGGVRFTSGGGAANQTVAWTPGNAAWTFSSDRNLKEGFKGLDAELVLDKISRLPVTEWNYKGHAQRHVGPMAQDFHALFSLNQNDTMLDGGDLHGVALAAIQGLNQKLEAQVKAKDSQIKSLEERVKKLEGLLETLTAQTATQR